MTLIGKVEIGTRVSVVLSNGQFREGVLTEMSSYVKVRGLNGVGEWSIPAWAVSQITTF